MSLIETNPDHIRNFISNDFPQLKELYMAAIGNAGNLFGELLKGNFSKL